MSWCDGRIRAGFQRIWISIYTAKRVGLLGDLADVRSPRSSALFPAPSPPRSLIACMALKLSACLATLRHSGSDRGKPPIRPVLRTGICSRSLWPSVPGIGPRASMSELWLWAQITSSPLGAASCHQTRFPDAEKCGNPTAREPAASRSRGLPGPGFQRRRVGRIAQRAWFAGTTKLHAIDAACSAAHGDRQVSWPPEGLRSGAEYRADAGGGRAGVNAAAGLHHFLAARRFVTDAALCPSDKKADGSRHCRRRRISRLLSSDCPMQKATATRSTPTMRLESGWASPQTRPDAPGDF